MTKKSEQKFTGKINGVTYGLNIKFAESHTFEIQVTFKIEIKSRKVRPLLKPE